MLNLVMLSKAGQHILWPVPMSQFSIGKVGPQLTKQNPFPHCNLETVKICASLLHPIQRICF